MLSLRGSLGRLALVVGVSLALLASSCSTKTESPRGSAGPAQRGGTLTVGLDAETDGWNPTASQWAAAAYEVAQTIFDPLMAYGADGKPHPDLARSVTPSADFSVWTIQLRPGIKFHDGEALDAAAVKLQLDMDKASFLVGQSLRFVKSIEATGDLTVRVTMTQPWVGFPAVLAGQAGFIAAPKQLKASGAAATDKPIGTGPYVFKEWTRDDHLTVTRNPHYWRKDVGYPNTVTFKVIPDDQSRLASVQSGQVDLMYTIVASVVAQARGDHSLQMHEGDSQGLTMVMLNHAVAPLDDGRIRRALMYATNQQQLIDTIGQGQGKLGTEPYLPSSPWYVPSGYPTKPDPGRAKALVAAYRKDHGISGPVKFTLGCTPTPTNTQAMKLVKYQWGKVGIDVKLNFTEQATYINNAITGKYQANCWAQLGATDPDADSVWWSSSNAKPVGQVALNFMRMKDPRVDKALDQARRTDDTATRKQLYGKVWKYFVDDLPYVYLPHPHFAVIWSAHVHGVGEGKLPDGSKPLLYQGEVPTVTPLGSVWVSS